jgi:MFS family permease
MPLALLCVAQFVVVLDVTIVAVALPAIRDDLGFSAAGLQWVITAYLLAFGGLLVSAGRAADLLGRRRVFVTGLALFAAASAGCGLAPSPAALVALRALQGVGAALLAPAALALVTELPDQRRALGIWTAAAAGGGATGWVLGGVLTETLGWPAIFLLNAPIGLAGVVLAPRVLRADRERARGFLSRLDLAGALLVTAGLAALVLGLTHAQPAALGGGLALLAIFAVVERRVRAPLLPPGTFGNRTFTRAVLVAAVLTATTTPAVLLSVLEQERSPIEIGLACLPLNLAVIAGSLLAGRVRVAPRLVMALGLAGVAGGAALMMVVLLPAYVLMGLGLGAASVASTASGTEALEARAGLASGLLNAAAQLGPALGLAVMRSYAIAAAVALVSAGVVLGAGQLRQMRGCPI